MEFRRYWEILVKWKWVFIQSVSVVFFISLFLVFISKPIYKTSAKVVINTRNLQTDFIGNLPAESGRLSYVEARNVPDTFISLFFASPVVSKVIQELDLRDRKGRTFDAKDLQINLFKIPKLLRQKKGFKIKQVGGSETLEITGYSDDLEQSVKLTNTLANTFIDVLCKEYKEEASIAYRILQRQHDDVARRLRLAEKSLERYKTKNIASDISNQSTNLIESLYSTKTQCENAEMSMAESISLLGSIKKTLTTVPEFYKNAETIEANPSITEHKSELRTLRLQLARQLLELKPEHPDVKATLAQVDALEKIIKDEIARTFSSETVSVNPYYQNLIERYGDTEIDIVTFSVRKEFLDKTIAKYYKELENIAKKEGKLNRLNREVDILNNMYRTIKQNLEYAKIAENINIANAAIIQPARTSINTKKDIFFPRKKLNLAAALVLGSLFGFLLTLLLEYTNDKVRTEKDLARITTPPLWRIIPKARKRTVGEEISPEFVDHFWNIKTHLDFFTQKKENRGVIVALSTNRGEGKTTVNKNLSLILAEAGHKVLLIDANLRHPSLHRFFEISNSVGLADYLSGRKTLQEVIQPSNRDNLKIIPCGSFFSHPLKIITPANLSELISSTRAEFNWVIFDTPAIRDGNDALIVSNFADVILLVVASGCVTADELQETVRIVQKINPPCAGTVFNKALTL